MKRSLLFFILSVFVATAGIAQYLTWPITITTDDGLPGVNGPQNYFYESMLYRLDEPLSTLRFTVVSTNTVDATGTDSYKGMSGAPGSAFPFFSLAELKVVDPSGEPIEYTATTNAYGNGNIGNLNDGKHYTYFQTSESNVDSCIREYHYIELKFKEPVIEFKIKWLARAGFEDNMPTYVGLTPGTQYLPFPEQRFTLGAQVTTVEELGAGGLFLIESDECEYITEDGKKIRNGGFWHSPYGAHMAANAAALVYLIPTIDENTYKVAWLNNRHFIKNSTNNHAEWLQWTDKETDAASIAFRPCEGENVGDFTMTMCDGSDIERTITADAVGRMVVTVTDSLSLFARPNKANFTIWKAAVNAGAIKFMLEEIVDEAIMRIESTDISNDELYREIYEELLLALESAKEVLNDSKATVNQVTNSRNAVNEALIPFALIKISQYSDSIDKILQQADEEYKISYAPNWVAGTYPESSIEILEAAMDAAVIPMSEAASLSLEKIDCILQELKQAITDFWASKITDVKSLPFRVCGPETGLPGTLEPYGGYVWESPVYYLSEATDTLRFTVFMTNSGQKYGDYVILSLAEFELFDYAGNRIELTEECFTTNSMYECDCGGFRAICDGNYDTRYISVHLNGQSPDGYTGKEGYVYIEVALPEEVSAFKFKQCGCNYGRLAPTDFAFGPGGFTITPENALLRDGYNALIGEKITDVSQITDEGIYVLQGLYGCDPAYNKYYGASEPRFYSALVPFGKKLQSPCAYKILKAEDGKYNILSLADGKYWSESINEYGWGAATSTLYKCDAADVFIVPNENERLPGSFVLYSYKEGIMSSNGEERPNLIFQDWDDQGLGVYPVKSLADNDKDGEGEWCIYKMTMDNPYDYWLDNLVASLESLSIMYSKNPGYPYDLGNFPEVFQKAKIAVENGNYERSEELVSELYAALSYIGTVSRNPIVEGIYVIEAACDGDTETDGVSKVLYFYLNDEPSDTSEYKLYWGDAPEDDCSQSSAMYQYQFKFISARGSDKVNKWLADSIITQEEADNAFYIKNVYYGKYIGIGEEYSWSERYVCITDKPEDVFIMRQKLSTKYHFWNPESGLRLTPSNFSTKEGAFAGFIYTPDPNYFWRLRSVKKSTPWPRYDITLEAENGSVSGAGNYKYADEATIKAVPDAGYIFVGWYSNGQLISVNSEYSFFVYNPMTIVAKFEKDTTGISAVKADGLYIYTDAGALVVESNSEALLNVYSSDGRLVERLRIASGKNCFRNLGKGLYIVNGVKVNIM